MKTPGRLHGMPCGILHGITMEHDGSAWNIQSIKMDFFSWRHRSRVWIRGANGWLSVAWHVDVISPAKFCDNRVVAHVELPWKKFSMEIPRRISDGIPWSLHGKRILWKFHLRKIWKLKGISWEIIHRITLEHDVSLGNSQTPLDSTRVHGRWRFPR